MVLPVRIIMSPNSSSTCLVEIHARSLIAGPPARTGTDAAPPCALVPRRAMTRVYLFVACRCWPRWARVLGYASTDARTHGRAADARLCTASEELRDEQVDVQRAHRQRAAPGEKRGQPPVDVDTHHIPPG